MHEVAMASLRAMRDFSRGDILYQALWPPLVSFFGWAAVAWFAWIPLSDWLLANLPAWSWLDWLGPYLVHVVLALLFAPLIYVTTLLLVAAFALPRMMAIVAARDYPEVSRHATPASALWGSIGNTFAASAIFFVGWLLCLPLLLVPGGLLVLPLLWSAWLNQRTFRFDVLAEHATADERRTLAAAERRRFWGAGFMAALVAHVPFANVLAPAFAALLFTHLGLSALRRLRQQEGVWVSVG
jgi:hypothetical protein